MYLLSAMYKYSDLFSTEKSCFGPDHLKLTIFWITGGKKIDVSKLMIFPLTITFQNNKQSIDYFQVYKRL